MENKSEDLTQRIQVTVAPCDEDKAQKKMSGS
jgi:hypothetical protein